MKTSLIMLASFLIGCSPLEELASPDLEDEIKVHLDSSFSAEERSQIQAAIDDWISKGARFYVRLVDDDSALVKVHRSSYEDKNCWRRRRTGEVWINANEISNIHGCAAYQLGRFYGIPEIEQNGVMNAHNIALEVSEADVEACKQAGRCAM